LLHSFFKNSQSNKKKKKKNTSQFPGLGTFHEEFRIDGYLFMVGVVDILPSGLSSVYLYFDPRFSALSPGRVSALYEIALTERLSRCVRGFDNYYMGFYIHSCPKMRYKAEYAPSELLCPVAYTWWPFADVFEWI
jgi:arginine-tRNA-protein transferase